MDHHLIEIIQLYAVQSLIAFGNARSSLSVEWPRALTIIV